MVRKNAIRLTKLSVILQFTSTIWNGWAFYDCVLLLLSSAHLAIEKICIPLKHLNGYAIQPILIVSPS